MLAKKPFFFCMQTNLDSINIVKKIIYWAIFSIYSNCAGNTPVASSSALQEQRNLRTTHAMVALFMCLIWFYNVFL